MRGLWILPVVQAGFVLVLVLTLPRNLFLSSSGGDLTSYFIAARAFAAESLRAGHWPLWNPYIYGGQPFLAGFESALFYPPTLVFVWLPLDRAMNFSLLGHLLILGWGMQYWAMRRGVRPLAAGIACLAAQFCGPVFPHLYAGHLSNLCTMAWAPWLFAFLDDWRRARSGWNLLFAAAAVCLQVLGGHVQYAFYTGVTVGLWALLHTALQPVRWRRELLAVAAVYVAGALLSAAQLLPGIAAASEGLHSGKVDFQFARMFSFPPENLLTLIAPGFFGDLTVHTYWGRCYLWEMSLFTGTASLVLVAVAACDTRWRRQAWLALGLSALLVLLAIGDHTPLFRLLYDFVPMFGNFRGISKFMFSAVLFLILTLAMGADAILCGRRPPPALVWSALGFGMLVGLAGLAGLAAPALLAGLPAAIFGTQETYLAPAVPADPGFCWQAATQAASSLLRAGGIFFLSGLVLWQARRQPRWGWLLLAVLPLEWAGFARTSLISTRLDAAVSGPMHHFLDAHPGDYRILNLSEPNNGFLVGKGDIWGNDPSVLRRYAEFITATQGEEIEHVSQYVGFRSLPAVYSMLRLRYAFAPTAAGSRVLEQRAQYLPRVLLVSGCTVLNEPGQVLAAVQKDSFDPRRMAYLEAPPDPRPEPSSNPGSVRVLDASPDALTIEADVASPALLVNTDLYSRGWRVRALTNGTQKEYHLMPVNYILRAVPLKAGHHLLRLEYSPPELNSGLAISAAAWMGWLILAGWMFRRENSGGPLPVEGAVSLGGGNSVVRQDGSA